MMSGRAVGAFFDMDNTVLSGSSGRLYLKYLRKNGYLPRSSWLRITGHVAMYVSGLTDFPHLMARLMTYVAGASEEQAWELSAGWFASMLQHYITEKAREMVAWHADRGHHVALVSASTPYAVAPVAASLGLGSAFLCTHLEVVDGHFTGRLQVPACYGKGKVVLTHRYAQAHDLDLCQSYFYSDSYRDLPLLEAVGHPIAVNPDRRLARIAAERGWTTTRFY